MTKLSSLQTTEATSSTSAPRAPGSQPSSTFFPLTRGTAPSSQSAWSPPGTKPSPVPSASMMSQVSHGAFSNTTGYTARDTSAALVNHNNPPRGLSNVLPELEQNLTNTYQRLAGANFTNGAQDANATLSNMQKLVNQAEDALQQVAPLSTTQQSGISYVSSNLQTEVRASTPQAYPGGVRRASQTSAGYESRTSHTSNLSHTDLEYERRNSGTNVVRFIFFDFLLNFNYFLWRFRYAWENVYLIVVLFVVVLV